MGASSHAVDLATFRAAVRLAVAQHTAQHATLARSDDDEAVEQLAAAGGAAVALLAAQYRAGRITKAQFIERTTERLSGNAEAAGRRGAAQEGDPSDFNDDALDGIGDRLDGFADTVADGGNSDKQIAAWALALGGIAWSVYQRGRGDGAVVAGKRKAGYQLDPGADHCDDCIERADGNPYDLDDMPSWPGDGSTQCGTRDRCWVAFYDGDDTDEGAD